jgi:hypothetical protein
MENIMTDLVEIAKKLDTAWRTKDEVALQKLLHKDYHFKGPMMEMKGAKEAIELMKNCPFESKTENCEVVVQDNKLVHIFDWNVTAPFQASIPVVEVLEFEGDKVRKSRLFFDTAKMPAQAKDAICADKKAACA